MKNRNRKSWRRLRPKDRRYYNRDINGPERREQRRRKKINERRGEKDGYERLSAM